MLGLGIDIWKRALSGAGDGSGGDPPGGDVPELYIADTGDGAQDNILLETGDLLLLE